MQKIVDRLPNMNPAQIALLRVELNSRYENLTKIEVKVRQNYEQIKWVQYSMRKVNNDQD